MVPVKHYPTDESTTYTAPGTYTYPDKTVTLTETATVVTSTTYVCPTAGTYTIGDSTTAVDHETTVEYPITSTWAPGTYTAPATTLTVTESSYVYVCPYSTVHPEPTPAPEEPAPAPEYPAPEPPKEEEHPAPEPPKEDYPPPSTGGGPTADGKLLGMTYTPYTPDGQCKDAGTVRQDLGTIKGKGIHLVRVYSTDCNALENIGPVAHELGINLILGVFIGDGGIGEAYPQIDDLAGFQYKDIVKMLVIGNEAVFGGKCSMGQLVELIHTARGKLTGAGYNCPITTTETLNVLQQSGSQLCGAVDVMGANIQPYFNSDVSPESAGDFVAGQLELVSQVCPGKEAFNLECGWPNAGKANGKAVVGPDAQRTAIQSIIEKVGQHTIVFSFHDDKWKAGDVEKHWGCIDSV